jgi:hypothetical protein
LCGARQHHFCLRARDNSKNVHFLHGQSCK